MEFEQYTFELLMGHQRDQGELNNSWNQMKMKTQYTSFCGL
jgi:hypothetical protein